MATKTRNPNTMTIAEACALGMARSLEPKQEQWQVEPAPENGAWEVVEYRPTRTTELKICTVYERAHGERICKALWAQAMEDWRNASK